MENCTNSTTICGVPDSTHSNLAGPGLGAYAIVMFSSNLVILALIIITIAALCVAHSVAKLVRVFLINHLIAILVTALVYIGFGLLALILNFTSSPTPDLWLCRVLVFGYVVVSIGRHYSLAAFSVVILLVVNYSKRSTKPFCITLYVVFIWTAAILLSIHILIPSVYAPQYYDNVTCFAQTDNSNLILEAKYSLLTIEVLFGKLLPVIIIFVALFITLCYFRRNTATERYSYNKGIAKLAVFLITCNILDFIAHVVVAVLINFQERVALFLSYTVSTAILFPPPILVYVFLKPVRDRVDCVICYCCRHPRPVYMASSSAHIPLVEKN